MSIDYALAKELKDAGFPQPVAPHIRGDYLTHEDDASGETLSYAPTLAELIEACGDDFWDLIKSRMRTERIWKADAYKLGSEISEFGDTPEEAVARLWLALQTKE